MSQPTTEQIHDLARKHGLRPALVKRLRGETLEELEADVLELVSEQPGGPIPAADWRPPALPSRTPREQLAPVPDMSKPDTSGVADDILRRTNPVGSAGPRRASAPAGAPTATDDVAVAILGGA